jgi:predicted nuclease with TOPRIM domain
MALQTEKLSQEVLDKIVKAQNETNEIIFNIGQVSFRLRELNNEIKKMEDFKANAEEKFDNLALQLENTLTDLQRKYPNGEIDLQEGVVKFETAE